MILYGAPGDTSAGWGRFRQAASTWDVSGPTFLRVYISVSVAVLIGTLVYRRRLYGFSASMADLGPQAVAYLNGGAKLAIYSCLGALHTAEAIDVPADGRLRQTGPLPSGAAALAQAVYHAAGQRMRPRDLASDTGVADAVRRLQSELEQAGLLVTAERLRAWRTGPLLSLGLVALGVIRTIAGIANDKPVRYLVLTLSGLAVVTAVLLFRTARRTRAGDEVLTRMRNDNRHLAPAQQPAWSTYGPVAAGMGVALFGTPAIWAADPAFASASEVQRQFATANGRESGVFYTGADGGSGYGGGGGGCCGGGGCGGGGCGGGGGGG
jgi:uncharacterized protein (TIGR04222 family)